MDIPRGDIILDCRKLSTTSIIAYLYYSFTCDDYSFWIAEPFYVSDFSRKNPSN